MEGNCHMDSGITDRRKQHVYISVSQYTQSSFSCTRHVYSFLLSPASTITFSPFYHISYSLVKVFPHWRAKQGAMNKAEEQTRFSKRPESSDGAAGLAVFPPPASFHLNSLKDYSPPSSFSICTAEPAQSKGSGWDGERFNALSYSRREPFYPDHLPPLEKAGLQAQGSRHMLTKVCQCDPSQLRSTPCRDICLHNTWAIPPRLSFVKCTETKHSRPQRKTSYSPSAASGTEIAPDRLPRGSEITMISIFSLIPLLKLHSCYMSGLS